MDICCKQCLTVVNCARWRGDQGARAGPFSRHGLLLLQPTAGAAAVVVAVDGEDVEIETDIPRFAVYERLSKRTWAMEVKAREAGQGSLFFWRLCKIETRFARYRIEHTQTAFATGTVDGDRRRRRRLIRHESQ